MNYPDKVRHSGKLYDINTDFKVGLKCFDIINDPEIDDLERAVGVIVSLFGIEMPIDEEAMELAVKFLSCGVDQEEQQRRKPDMDFKQDAGYLQASFQQDYQIDLSSENIHWWRFMDLVSGFSDKTIMSRVREIRNYDLKDLPDEKSRREMAKLQKELALDINEEEITEEEFESYSRFNELMGIKE